jgi:hypothetical protein
MIRLLSILSLFILSGCAAQVHPPSACPPQRYPPAIYLQDVQTPVFAGTTNADLALYVLDLRKALDVSNSDKAALRRWADSIK